MKKPLLLFALKCMVIIYFAACTRINNYTVDTSITSVVTKGSWKVNLHMDGATDFTSDFSNYIFQFSTTGKIRVHKNGVIVEGNWLEDNIAKKISIHLSTNDINLSKLNDHWDITSVGNGTIQLKNNHKNSIDQFNIASL